MNNLISIENHKINNEKVETVNARELHEFLEVRSNFRDWIRNRINDFDFIENLDFITNAKNLAGGGRSIEFYISFSMAKELSMVERNEKGKKARKYFIECERISKEKSNKQFAIPQTLSEALQLASDQAKQLELQAPKVNYYDKVAKNTTHLNATQVAQKVGLSAVAMNKHLTELKVYNKSIKRGKAFNQWFIDDGYGEMKQTALGYSQAVFTVKGEQYIIEILTSEGII